MANACSIKYSAQNTENILTKAFGEDIASELINLNQGVADFSKTLSIDRKTIVPSELYEELLAENRGDEIATILAKAAILLDYQSDVNAIGEQKKYFNHWKTMEPKVRVRNVLGFLQDKLNVPVHLSSRDFYTNNPDARADAYVLNGEIYINSNNFALDAPLHEYTHLWALSMQYHNPEGWQSIVDLVTSLPEFEFVDDLGNINETVAEFLAQYSGQKNSYKLSTMAESSLDILAQALSKFWDYVKSIFDIKSFNTIDEVADRVFYDLLTEQDLKLNDIYDRDFSEYLNPQYDVRYGKFADGRLGIARIVDGQLVIILANDITRKKVFDYIYRENESFTSQQKKQVFRELAEDGYTEEYLRTLIATDEDAENFIKYHEISDFIHSDHDLYWKSGTNLLTADKIEIEKRATLDAIKALMYQKYLYNHKNYHIEKDSGITFTESNGSYKQRTEENAKWADVTLAIAADFNTAGEKLTKTAAGKKYISIDLTRLKDVNKDAPKVEIFEGYWTRKQVAAQTDKVFLFGDNTNDRVNTHYIPSATQAVIRELPNAIGIDTKKNRGTTESSYFTDADFDTFKIQVDNAIAQAKASGKTIVIPADGIGTGKAQLKERAPKLYKYLQDSLDNLKNRTGIQQKSSTGGDALQKLLKNWQELKLKKKNIKLNIAGNGIYTLKDFDYTQRQADNEVKFIIQFLLDNGITISEIRSGGQTGIDESGIKAAIDLGIKASIHAPKNYKFRTLGGKDIESESAFKARFIKPEIEIKPANLADPTEITQKVKLIKYNTLSEEDKYIYDFIQALNLDKDSKNWYIYSFVNGDPYAIAQIRKFMEQYSVRQAELLVDGKFFATPYLNQVNGHYDWKGHFGGLDIFKPIKYQQGYQYTVVKNYVVHPAEIIIPKLYASKFRLGNRSLFEITPKFFENSNTFYESPLIKAGIKSDFLVRTHSDNFSIIITNSFSDSKMGSIYEPQIKDGFVLDVNGDKLFKINDINNVDFRMVDHHLVVLVKNNDQLTDTIDTILDKTTLQDVVSIQPFLDNINLYGNQKAQQFIDIAVDNSEFKFLNGQLFQTKSAENISEALREVYNKNKNTYKKVYSRSQYESFVKTLKIMATRIPTQALQSFMEMQVAAFTGDFVNAAFVSRWQLWLQGSDYDIDKAFLLGFGTNKHGFVRHWSPLADYSTEELRELSDTLPVPTNKRIGTDIRAVTDNTKSTLVQEYLLSLIPKQKVVKYPGTSKEQVTFTTNPVEQLSIIRNILREINKSGVLYIPEVAANSVEAQQIERLINRLNKHNLHKLTTEEAQNIVTQNIHKVIVDPRNFNSSYSPIDRAMNLFLDEIKKLPGDKRIHSYDDGLSIHMMQFENSVGKDDVGIMANGLKVFFNMTQYFNRYFKNSPEAQDLLTSRQWFLRNFKLRIGNSFVETNKSTISDIQVEEGTLKVLNSIFQQLVPKYYKQGLSHATDDASLLISSLVSLATDNAKTLALNKIKAGLNVASIHVYLTIMGINPKDIVAYTQSPIWNKITELLNANVFDASTGRFTDDTWNQLQAWARNNDYREDYAQFEQLYYCAQEITNLARIFGINQGIKADAAKASSFIYNFGRILQDKIKQYKSYITPDGFSQSLAQQLVIDHGYSANELNYVEFFRQKINRVNELVKKYNIDLNNFQVNTHKYFTDEKYRDLCVEVYDLIKSTFNIYDIVNHSPNFYAMLAGFDTFVQILTIPVKGEVSLVQGHQLWDSTVVKNTYLYQTDNMDYPIKRDMYKVSKTYKESEMRSATRFVDDYIISELLTEFGDQWAFTYGEKSKLIKVHFKTNQNLRDFVSFVNGVLIPKLKLLDKKNPFLKAMVLNMSEAREKDKQKRKDKSVQYVLNFNLDKLNPKSDDALKAQQIFGGFKRIQNIKIADILNTFSNPDLTVGDIMYLYNLIISLNANGQNSLSRLFENYIKKPDSIYVQYSDLIKQYDLRQKQMNISQEMFMAFVLRNRARYSNRAGGIVKFSNGTYVDTNGLYLFNLGNNLRFENNEFTAVDRLIDLINRGIIELVDIVCE